MAIYMKIDGVEGNVTQKGYEGWIEVLEYGWMAVRSIANRTGSMKNRSASSASVGELEVRKLLDEASPKLVMEALQGQQGKTVNLHVVDGPSDRKVVEYTLSNTLISSYDCAGKGDRPRESLALNFSKIEIKVTPYNEDNQAGSPQTIAYDLVAAAG